MGVSTASLVQFQLCLTHRLSKLMYALTSQSQVMIEDNPFEDEEDIYDNPGSHAPSETADLSRISGRHSSSSLSAYFIITTENLEEE